MENSKLLTILFCSILMLACGCDETFKEDPAIPTNPDEVALSRDWQFQYIVLGTDTLIHWDFDEPTVDGEFQTEIQLQYLRYELDHSYELRSDLAPRALGRDENYQPNYGYWDISVDGETLIHNKLMDYETQYKIILLTKDSLIREEIGGRYNFKKGIYEKYIEVFIPQKR